MTYTALATHTMKHENVLSAEAPSAKDAELKVVTTLPLSIVTASDSNLVLTLSN